ncbi:MAG TPA: alpha/beta hydrolase [bacterium]|nr:alpha/beta hydrolase [bacterium]
MTGRLLAHTLLTAPDVRPGALLVVLHGFFGAGRNWRTVARGLTIVRPDWGVVLVDLRLHGASQGFSPPHTVDACARDVADLAAALKAPVGAVLGHSFGGKVALAYLRSRPGPHLRQVWVIDADPSAAPPGGGAWALLRTVEGLPPVFPNREACAAALERSGFDRPIADWMTTNLERTEDGYRWRLDFASLEALLRDFFQADLWPVVERVPPETRLYVVKAEASSVISEASVSRLEAIGRASGRVAVARVPGGHWLNADNPEDMRGLLAARLPVEPPPPPAGASG